MLTINARYQVTSQPIGQGGMGVVYKAYDIMTKRDVAVKTMRGSLNQEALDLFSKEWMVLARVSHPNIVDILDTGEFDQDGERKPFFVMPLLPGVTLERLIDNSSSRLTTERVVGIIAQACRGLHAAHERGLIHRDIKPSNIFVMDDDTVKIIDFGVVHLAGGDSMTGLKGTLQYMAPENIEMKGTSAAVDIFALGVVCYQALTGRKPFARKTESETVEAILRYIPPPVYELNPLVSQTVSRVIHKAMAKTPYHRFSTAREFGETLQKALHGQPIERFDREKIQPRIERARKTQMEGDYQFASEILAELEAEGHIDPEISVLRIQLDQAVRQKSIRQLLDGARIRLEEDEFPLALQKIQQVLQIDPENPDALALRKQIEKQSGERQAQTWFKLVEQHLHNHSFGQARQALEEILKLNASDSRARKMLADVDQREEEITRLHAEKEGLYQSALDCYQHGEISSALSKLERVLELHSQSTASALPDRGAQYQSFYNQVRTERDAARSTYAEGRQHLTDKNFAKALEICGEFLKKSPGDRMFQALKLEIEEQQRQEQSAYIAEIGRRVEGEADLDRRVNILKEAVERYPEEPHFQQVLRLMRERRDLVNGIVAKANQYEERGQFNEAIGQFDILRNIYSQYPGLEFETERLRRRRDEQVREESKARFVDQIDRNLSTGNYGRARDIVHAAIVEFPHDEELSGLEQMVQRELDRSAEAEEWLQRGQKLCADGNLAAGLEALRKSASLDARNAITRSALASALVEAARAALDSDWRRAEPLIEEALSIDAGHLLAKSLQGQVLDRKRQEAVNNCLSQVREMRAKGDVAGALAKVDEALAVYPNEARLLQVRKTLQRLDEETVVIQSPVRRPETPSAAVQPAQKAQTPPLPVPPVQATQILAAASSPAAEPGVIEKPSTLARSPVETSGPPPPMSEQLKNLAVESTGTSREIQKTDAPTGTVSSHVRKGSGPVVPFGKIVWATLGAGIVLIAFGLTAIYLRTHRHPPLPPSAREFVVDLQSNVSDVAYKVDDKPPSSVPLRLGLGAHTIEASAVGYKSETRSITLSANSPKPSSVTFQLAPEPVRIKLESTLKSGTVSLDGGESENLQDGQFVKEGIALSTDHTFSLIQAGKESLTFSFRAEPGKAVTLSALKARDLNAVIISDLGSSARVYANATTLQGAFNDQPLQLVPQEGLVGNNLPENAEVTLDDGKTPHRLTVEQGNAPSLAIHLLAADPQDANIQIQSNVPGATLFVDNKKFYVLKPGKPSWWIVLQPGTHMLRAEKEGFQPSAEQKVEVKKGDVITNLHAFDLKPVVLTGSLVIEGATPQSTVFIDNAQVGSTDADGSFKRTEISPGNHILMLRKLDFEDKQLSRTFTAGQEVHISAAEGQLTQYGALEFHVTPPSATITYKRSDEPQHQVENGKTVRIRAGRYTVTVNAEKYQQRADTLAVEPGKTQSITWTLTPQPTSSAPAPVTPAPPERYFEDQGAWVQNEGWWIHKGPVVTWMAARQGVFQFEYLRQQAKGGFLFIKKKPGVDWVIDEKDANNRVEYSFDFKNLERRAVVSGKAETKKGKLPPAAATSESYPIQIDINPERIIIRDAQGTALDTYQRPNPSEPLGKFGFKGEVALKVTKK